MCGRVGLVQPRRKSTIIRARIHTHLQKYFYMRAGSAKGYMPTMESSDLLALVARLSSPHLDEQLYGVFDVTTARPLRGPSATALVVRNDCLNQVAGLRLCDVSFNTEHQILRFDFSGARRVSLILRPNLTHTQALVRAANTGRLWLRPLYPEAYVVDVPLFQEPDCALAAKLKTAAYAARHEQTSRPRLAN